MNIKHLFNIPKRADYFKQGIRKNKWLLVLFLFTFIPHFFGHPKIPGSLGIIGFPGIFSGDEPHFLVMIHSLLQDHDLDLANNYYDINQGARLAGWRNWPYFTMIHHTAYYIKGKFFTWHDIYTFEGVKPDNKGIFKPRKKKGVNIDVDHLPEISGHPPGMPILVSFFLYPFRNIGHIEPLSLFIAGIMLCLTTYYYAHLLNIFTNNRDIIILITFMTIFATPLWSYGRQLFSESFMSFPIVFLFYSVLKPPPTHWVRLTAAGFLFGFTILMKPPIVIILIPLTLYLAYRKKYCSVLIITSITVGFIILYLYLNSIWFGSPWHPSHPFKVGNIIKGILGNFFYWNKGYFILIPAVILPIYCIRFFYKKNKAETILFMASFLTYFIIFSLYKEWWGGYCYGSRYTYPLIPLLFVFAIQLPELINKHSKMLLSLVCLCCIASIIINFLGALFPQFMWGDEKSPFFIDINFIGS